MQWVAGNILGEGENDPYQLRGTIALGESIFGCKSKYHRGEQHGMKVSILWMQICKGHKLLFKRFVPTFIIVIVDSNNYVFFDCI